MKTNYAIGICLLLLMTWSSHANAQVNTTVETFRVPSDGSAVTAKTRFKQHKIYYIIADGRVFDNRHTDLLADAEYDFISATLPTDTCGDGVTDTGIGINAVPVVLGGSGKTNRWGAFNASNRYEVVYWSRKEDSVNVSFNYHDCVYNNNKDHPSDPLRIEIQVPQAEICTDDVPTNVVFPDDVGGVHLGINGSTFEFSTKKAYMCAGATFLLTIESTTDQALIVRDPGSLICESRELFDVSCVGHLDKTVKLTVGTFGGRQTEKLRTYTLIPVDPYK